ncbi:MAG: hypothetical protein QW540_08035 [Archaeoglobaceae archaeon]
MFTTVVPGGTKNNPIGTFASIGESLIIDPGYASLLEFTNISGATTSLSVRAMWWEE